MPDITDPEAIQFSQDYIRPAAEQMRWMQHTLNEMIDQWNGGTNAKFPNDASAVMDGNGTAHPYTGANANTIITRAQSLVDVLDAAFAMDGVLPACVRALGPSSGPGG